MNNQQPVTSTKTSRVRYGAAQIQQAVQQLPARVRDLLCDPVDIASLVFFRIAFGAILLWEVVRYFQYGRIVRYFVEPKFYFKYYGFEWVHPWSAERMDLHFAALGVLAFLIAIGCCYRLAAALFFFGFTYVFLLDQTQHLNHFYLICLISFLLIFIPAHSAVSVDAWLRPKLRRRYVPGWPLRLLQTQIAIVYFYGGIAKLNSDWLNCRPVADWIGRRTDLPIIGPWLAEPAAGWIVAYGGLTFDLAVVPLLCWRKTRPYAFAAAMLFHLTNSQLFHIGIFPWFMMAATAMFFRPDWPRRLLPKWIAGRPVAIVHSKLSGWQRAGVAFTVVYLTLQLAIPLRHFVYPGNSSWNELGHRFSWQMKLRDKKGKVGFIVTRPDTGKSWWYKTNDVLNERQIGKMTGRPDMLRQFAHYIHDEYRRAGVNGVEVRVETWITLNGHACRRLIDPTVNLAAQPRTLRTPGWIVPFDAEWNAAWPSIGRLFTGRLNDTRTANAKRRREPKGDGTQNGPLGLAGTASQREALFNDLVEKTLAREAISPVKNTRLGLDYERDAAPLRREFVSADTEQKLFRAVVRLGNLRKNSHLKVSLPHNRRRSGRLIAPIRFLPDYRHRDECSIFVSDLAIDLNEWVFEISPREIVPGIGDRLVRVNDHPVEDYCTKIAPYLRYSTREWLLWKLAEEVAAYHPEYGLNSDAECVQLTLERDDGEQYRMAVSYLPVGDVRWSKMPAGTEYRGFTRVLETKSFELFQPHSADRNMLLLKWLDFGPTLTGDVESLMRYAERQRLLDCDVICDMTDSGGGKRAWYLLQRLASRPFKVTYGNLRISDVTDALANSLVEHNISSPRLDAWFQNDVQRAIRDGLAYTAPVPFKLRALPPESNGMLEPVERRFRGRTVCLFGPKGVSQVDQFAAMFIDNELGHSIGMPTRGSSNTWEWHEPVDLPGSGHRVAWMMWSLGNVIRPNGEVLEGNPPQPAEYVPLTRANHSRYLEQLVNRACRWLQRDTAGRTAAVSAADVGT